MKAKHVILISLDGVFEQDLSTIQNLPHLGQLMKTGAFSKEVQTVYPTLTYPIHTSMVTGVYPNKHKIIHNHPLQPGVPSKNQRWHWYRKEVKSETLYDKAAEKGLKTAGIFWPVSGKSKIKYNMPEVVAINGENQTLKILKAGSPCFLIQQELKNGKIRKGIQQPQLDQFATAVTVDTIKSKKPNLLLLHLIGVDDFRHRYGVFSEKAKAGIVHYDQCVGKIIQATKDAGIYEDTIFVVATDHGQMDIHHYVHLNNLLEKEGYITYKDGEIKDYKAYAHSIGLGAYVYVKNQDPKITQDVKELLSTYMKQDQLGIEAIYEGMELKRLKGDTSYAFSIEAKAGFAFVDSINEKDVRSLDDENKVYATHGYSPEKFGYKNVIFISGREIRPHFNIGPMNIVDIAPTLAEILDLQLKEAEGKSLKRIFKGGEGNE